MNIGIIGTGISGLSCAYLLHKDHDITVFESADRIGGHTATIDVELQGNHYAIDTGFIVYNDWTYPNFIRLMDELGVISQPTDMSFSVSCKKSGLEYGGSDLNSLFAQRRNLFNLSHLGMIKDILRFNREAIRDLDAGLISESKTLGDYLDEHRYGRAFMDHYLIPMGSAIWSATLQDMRDFPLLFFVRFFKNHGLLSVNNRPQWRVLKGGSRAYLEPLTRGFRDRIELNASIVNVNRSDDGVTVVMADGSERRFDHVVFACHSDQALALLGDASDDERQILGDIPYRNNEVVLHTDERLLPQSKRAWSSWNYQLGHDRNLPAVLSYNMNMLQGIHAEHTFVVTLNASDQIAPETIIGRFNYAHPMFTLSGMAAQQRWSEINGVRNTWFCGAYWRNGFHEDGCFSGIRVAKSLGASW